MSNKCPTIEELYGLLAQVKPDFKTRAGQAELSNEIARAISERRHIIIEAPTGFGKSFAALVPAICQAVSEGKRVVISTGTLALQDQYAEKDVPTLIEALKLRGLNITYAVAKGRSNYVCRAKLDEIAFEGASELMQWSLAQKITENTGDVSSVPFKFLPDDWQTVGANDDCERKGCVYHGEGRKGWSECFVYQAQRRFLDAQIVITNHTLALLDIGQEPGSILGPYDVLLFDEAHSVPNKARDTWGAEIKPRTISKSMALVRKLLDKAQVGDYVADHNWHDLEDAIFKPLAPVIAKGENIQIKQIKPAGIVEQSKEGATLLVTILREVNNTLNSCIAYPETHPNTILIRLCKERILKLAREVMGIYGDNVEPEYAHNWLSFLTVSTTPKGVRYGVLNLKPIEVAPLLRDRLFNWIPTVVLMSATMQIGGTFKFMSMQLGLPENAIEFVGESPFDLEKNVLVYLPKHLPESHEKDYLDAMAQEVREIITHSQGRSLVLFTNVGAMRYVHDMLFDKLGYHCYLQGTASKQKLLQAFTENVDSCLFATKTFFEGIDVPGDSLSCVILTKAPFPVPTDPLFTAQCQNLEDKGLSAFGLLSMPNMLFDLRQAFGRLIRTTTDTGTFALLDSRAAWRKGYSNQVRSALPQSRVVTRLNQEPGKVDTATTRYNPRVKRLVLTD